MAPVDGEAPVPDPVCTRCSRLIRPGTTSQFAGRPVHMLCQAKQTRLEAIELREETRRTRDAGRQSGAAGRRLYCPACGRSLWNAGSVLFQDDQLVHALCWRAPEPGFMESHQRVPANPEARATILIVEDHADSREAMGLLVAQLGYRAILAATGTEALTVLRASRPDLILCDVRMPGMDGFEFVRAVRDQPDGAGVKIIAVTGVSERPAVERLLKAGFDAHLVKPIDYDVLLEALDRILWMPPKR